MHHADGIISCPVNANAAPLLFARLVAQRQCVTGTCAKVNVEVAIFRYISLLCVSGARFAAAFE